MSFWNTVEGLFVLIVVFAIAIVFAGGIGWALFNGGLPYYPRSGYFIAVALLLPLGAGWLLIRSLHRRRLLFSRPVNYDWTESKLE